MTYYNLTHHNLRKLSMTDKISVAIERLEKRTHFHTLLYKLLSLCYERNLRLVLENPVTNPSYLSTSAQNFPSPTIIDNNRMLRGDYYKKPTGYWFVNFTPSRRLSEQNDKERKTICNAKKSPQAGICSEERSMISSDYARNFICDFILDKKQDIENIQPTLF